MWTLLVCLSELNTIPWSTKRRFVQSEQIQHHSSSLNSASFAPLGQGNPNSSGWNIQTQQFQIQAVALPPSQLKSVTFAPKEAQQRAATLWELWEGAGRCAVQRDEWRYWRANSRDRVNYTLHCICTCLLKNEFYLCSPVAGADPGQSPLFGAAVPAQVWEDSEADLLSKYLNWFIVCTVASRLSPHW